MGGFMTDSKFVCWLCDSEFSSMLQLWVHTMVVHEKIKAFENSNFE